MRARSGGIQTTAEGGAALMLAATLPEGGQYVDVARVGTPHPCTRDPAYYQRFWDVSMKLLASVPEQ